MNPNVQQRCEHKRFLFKHLTALGLEPEVEAFDEQQTVSIQVEEKRVFCLATVKTFYQSICPRLKGKSAFRVGPLISDMCHPFGLACLDSV